MAIHVKDSSLLNAFPFHNIELHIRKSVHSKMNVLVHPSSDKTSFCAACIDVQQIWCWCDHLLSFLEDSETSSAIVIVDPEIRPDEPISQLPSKDSIERHTCRQ